MKRKKSDPYATPAIADYYDFPPTYLVWDESESLAVDAEALRDKLQAAGCDVTAEGYPDCFHAFATVKVSPRRSFQKDGYRGLFLWLTNTNMVYFLQ